MLVGLALIGVFALSAGCSSGGGAAWSPGGGGGGGAPSAEPAKPQLTAKVTNPPADAADVPASTALAVGAELGTVTGVELTDAAGRPVNGKLAKDRKTWQPTAALQYGTRYTASVTATGSDGRTVTATSSFTTMPKPQNLVRVSTQIGDDAVIGVAMPLIVNFGRPIPKASRDDVQRRMSVTTTPPQVGAWNWLSGTEVQYRPKAYWKARTRLSFRVGIGGLPLGDGWYGGADVSVRASVGSALIMKVDNGTKMMTVTRDGKVLRTIPVSLGKPKTPTSSGTMIVMEKLRKTVFDTLEELGPVEGYRTDIEYAQRFTWGGEFIHAAPWSVAHQGRRNVSHGCVNMSMANALWLFGQTKVGDPIVIRGTEVKLKPGNGWTAWNVGWTEWAKGSALPT